MNLINDAKANEKGINKHVSLLSFCMYHYYHSHLILLVPSYNVNATFKDDDSTKDDNITPADKV